MDSTDSLNNDKFISSDSFEAGKCFKTWFQSNGYIPAALNPDIKFLFFNRCINQARKPIKVYIYVKL